jgi:exopolysaccharide/PEP-CTERM locus tyrosine autokinase
VSIIEKAADRLSRSKAEIAHPVPIKAIPEERSRTVREHRVPDLHPQVPNQVNDIDLVRLKKSGMITPGTGRTTVAEQFRAIKRPLIRNAFNHQGGPINHGNLIMVTSSMAGEGKTFCSINLAMSIAMEMDHTVLLVDTDVRQPSVLRSLGLRSDAGLIDILLDERLQLADVLIKTNVETLSILPSGKNHENATELLASQTMASLLDVMSNRYRDRIVIFDSSPLLVTSEARALASHMGQIVMVVEAETTTEPDLMEALGHIETCPNISLIYNKGREFPGGDNYRYYRN